MRTLVITNQKGGCGKTTTSINLACALAQMGQKVLLIDLDPQAHATLGLGYDPENLENTAYHVITNRRFSISKAVLDTKIEGLRLIPSNIRLSNVELELSLVSQKEFILADQLKKIGGNFDYCVVDCPPSLGLLTYNALVASTDIIVPVQVHYYALEGLKQLLETIKTARKRFYPCTIKILGLLLTFVEERAALSKQVEEQMKTFFGNLVFKTVIHRTISLAEAPSAGEPILTYAPESRGAVEYKALAKEILESGVAGKTTKAQDITEICEKIQTAERIQIADKPNSPVIPEKTVLPAAETVQEEKTVSKHEALPPFRNNGDDYYHARGRKHHVGRILFLLILLAITIAAAVITLKNNPTVAEPNSVTVPEDTPTKIILKAKDKDRDDLTYRVTSPEHGKLSGTAPYLTYTPNENYNGSDSFSFIVNDKRVDSNSAAISITVVPVNDPPTADAQSVSVKIDKSLPITLTGRDIDSKNITFNILIEPRNGTITNLPDFKNSGNIIYSPKSGFTGPDSFTFVTNDGQSNSNPATIKINVTKNNPPSAEVKMISTSQNSPVTIVLSGQDMDGDTLTYKIVTDPSHGTLSGSAPNLTYTPNDHYSGPDSFTYLTNDGKDDSTAAAVSITVKHINEAPAAQAGTITTQEDTPVPVNLIATDPDGDTISYKIVTLPKHGTFSQTPPNLLYKPNDNYNGTDSFSYKVNDGTLDGTTATVSITIEPVEDSPAAGGKSVTINEDTPTTIKLDANDPDADPLTCTIERAPAHGTISGTGTEIVYTPDKDFNWLDSFTFSVSDGKTKSNTATVLVTVNSVNDPPAAIDDKAETFEDAPIEKINVLSNDTDVDKDPLTIKTVTQGPHGKVEINPDNTTLKYTPEPNYYGIDRFTYTAQDTDGLTSDANVEIKITPLNDAPKFTSTPVTKAMPGVLYIYDVNASDPDSGDNLIYSLLSKPDGMTIDVKTGIIKWMPDEILSKPVEVSIQAADNNEISASAVQRFSVQVIPAPPKVATLTVVNCFNAEGRSVFSTGTDANIVNTIDKKYLEIRHNSSLTFDFSKVQLPPNSKITSLVVYVSHYENDSFADGKAKWAVGTGWPDKPQVWFTLDSPMRKGANNNSLDSWDAASFVNTAQKLDTMQFQIINNDSAGSIFIDNIYMLVQWDWPESPDLVEYKLKPVR